jgi:transcriptional regulator with XRE-family HTH domain
MDMHAKIGKAVKKRRTALGRSQQDLAGDADMERTYISAVENGHKYIRVDTLVRLAEALDMEPWTLLKDALK